MESSMGVVLKDKKTHTIPVILSYREEIAKKINTANRGELL
jgi:hypothetical protein